MSVKTSSYPLSDTIILNVQCPGNATLNNYSSNLMHSRCITLKIYDIYATAQLMGLKLNEALWIVPS